MTPDQVSGFFDAGEAFVEGTIAAALVALWIIALALQMARPYMVRNLHRFSLRLGADLWWIIYVAVRDLFILQVFLGSFIFFYPDVVLAQDLPITGGLAACAAFGVLVIKLTTRGDSDLRWFRVQTLLLGLGGILYVVPYVLGVQITQIEGAPDVLKSLVTSQNPELGLPLCYISAAIVGVLALYAVAYNLRQASVRRPKPTAA
jgi:hypothetical protein